MMNISKHAEIRSQQRGICEEQLEIVLDYGTRIYNGGALFCFMSAKDVPGHLSGNVKEHVQGITLIINPGTEDIVTVYKNKQALKAIKRKMKYQRRIGCSNSYNYPEAA